MDYGMQIVAASARRIWQGFSVFSANLSGESVPGYRGDSLFAKEMEQLKPGRKPEFSLQSSSNFGPGFIKNTGRQLDVAINGKGWLVVQTSEGTEGLTRNGLLTLTPNGNLLAGTGQPLMGDNGIITLPEFSQLTIGDDGSISVIPKGAQQAEEVARIRLVNPAEATLSRGPDGLFRVSEGTALDVDEQVKLTSGALEESNVELFREYLGIVDSGKTMELHVRMMKTLDQTAARGNELLHGRTF